MLFFLIGSVFLPLLFVFFTNISSLLLSLVVLEMMTFILLWAVGSVYTVLGTSILMIMFCLFVLESVLGLVGLLNMIHFTGSDYVQVKVILCSWMWNQL